MNKKSLLGRLGRTWLPLLCGLCLVAPALPAAAQASYPTRPVRLIIPFAPGGPTDLIGRALAKNLSQILGQQFVVENKPGASGVIGAQVVAHAEPDGYTLMFHEVAATFAIQPILIKAIPYDVHKDFTPVGLAARGPIFLLVNDKLPVKNVKELVALAKSKPGSLTFASAGGSGQLPTHIGPELLMVKQNVKFLHVPYKGAGPALVDVAAGRISFMMTTGTGSAKAFLDSGTIRAIAVTGNRRSDVLPNVPTFSEAGVPLPELDEGTAWGVFGPGGMSPKVVATLNQALNKALQSPELHKAYALLDIYPRGSSAQGLKDLITKESTTWPPLLKKMDIQPD